MTVGIAKHAATMNVSVAVLLAVGIIGAVFPAIRSIAASLFAFASMALALSCSTGAVCAVTFGLDFESLLGSETPWTCSVVSLPTGEKMLGILIHCLLGVASRLAILADLALGETLLGETLAPSTAANECLSPRLTASPLLDHHLKTMGLQFRLSLWIQRRLQLPSF